MTLIKVCGLMRAEDVHAAVQLGVSACGFVLCESPRNVSPQRARRLAGGIRGALTVGVVATEPPAWVADAINTAGLGAVQLSAGSHGPSVAATRAAMSVLDRRPLIIAAADVPDAAAADLILLDARLPGVYGGTGRALDWAALARRDDLDYGRLVLAGGLTPANVGEAVAALRPHMVDVSSGVETSPGVKDPALLRAFFATVQQADGDAGGSVDRTMPAAQGVAE